MKIAVLGAGSIGLHLSAQLWQGGHRVTVICRRPEQAGTINENGLTYLDLDGHAQQIPLQAISLQDPPQPWDWLFLTVKQTHVSSTLSYLQNIKGKIQMLCFQNGIGHQERIKEELPHAKIYVAVTTEGAYREGPSIVRHTGKGITALGNWDGKEQDHKLQELEDLFSKTNMKVHVEDDIKQRIWKKLIVNSCINPLTALLGVNNGKLLEIPAACDAMETLFTEAQAVAQLEGIKIDRCFLQEIVTVCRNTYLNKSSMLQDIEAGRKTEIDYINGAIYQMGQHYGYSASCHSLLKDLIQAKEHLAVMDKKK